MRRLRIVAAVAIVSLGAVWACTFPDVTFGTAPIEPDEAGTDSSVPETGAPDAPPIEEEEEQDAGPITIDGASLDALVVEDAGGKVDASGCVTCDCDGDNYNDLGKAGCAAAGGANDCDDRDTRSHPNQGFVFNTAEPPRNGDWDCNNSVEKLYPEGASCAGLTLGLGCANIFGFTEPSVACGVQGTWIRCRKKPGLLALACEVGEQKLETQLCK
jgi:hypothetical protein